MLIFLKVQEKFQEKLIKPQYKYNILNFNDKITFLSDENTFSFPTHEYSDNTQHSNTQHYP